MNEWTPKRLHPDSIRDSIRIRIVAADSIRDSIRTKISDSQVPNKIDNQPLLCVTATVKLFHITPTMLINHTKTNKIVQWIRV